MCLECVGIDTVGKMAKSKKVQVSFTSSQWEMISRLKGVMGESDADIVRNVVLAWMSEKSFVREASKRRKK